MQLQRALKNPTAKTLTPDMIRTLQRTHGNHFVQRLIEGQGTPTRPTGHAPEIQRVPDIPEGTPVLVQNSYKGVVNKDTGLGYTIRFSEQRLHSLWDNKIFPYQEVDTRDYSHASASLFSPALNESGEFLGAGLQGEEQQARQARIQGGEAQPFDGDVRIDMLVPRIQQAEQQRLQYETANAGTDAVGVFLAPEWYFKRAPEPYSDAERDQIISRLEGVSANYPQVVIVPGTIVWRKAGGGKFSRQRAEMGNLAPVIFGGKTIMRHEKFINAGDTEGYQFDEGDAFGEADEDHMRGDNVKKANREYKRHRPDTMADAGTSFFEIGNVEFSVEICGDHSSRNRAFQEMVQSGTENNPAQGAHVQLLVSHGAAFSRSRHAGRLGGVGFHADATLNEAGVQQGFEYGVSKVGQVQNPAAPMFGGGRPTEMATTQNNAPRNVENLDQGTYALP